MFFFFLESIKVETNIVKYYCKNLRHKFQFVILRFSADLDEDKHRFTCVHPKPKVPVKKTDLPY